MELIIVLTAFLSLVANFIFIGKIGRISRWPNSLSSVELTYYCVKSWSEINKTTNTSAGLSLGGKEKYFAILEKCDHRGKNLNYGPYLCQTPELLTEGAMYCLTRKNKKELIIRPFPAGF